MFWAVVKISLLSILKSSETINREEKVLCESSIIMIVTIVSFLSILTVLSANQRANNSSFADLSEIIN